MTDKLPPNLLALFAPRPPLRWVPPSDHAPEDRKTANITGVAAFLPQMLEYKDKDNYMPTESWLQRKDRIKLEKKQKREDILKNIPSTCEIDPICFSYLFSTLVRLLGIHATYMTRRADVWMFYRQACRRPKYSRRCVQDPYCCKIKL